MATKRGGRVLGLLALCLLLAGPAQGVNGSVNILDYLETQVGQKCTYTCVPPPSFPDFTVTLTRLSSGPFAGKYRLGDYYTQDPGAFSWFIFDYGTSDFASFRIFASSAGTYDPPLSLGAHYLTDTVVPHPFEANIYWYFKKMDETVVPAGTYRDIMVWIVLDGAFPPNAWHEILWLDRNLVPFGVTGITFYARGIGEIRNINVDAGTGNVAFQYWLKKYQAGTFLPFLLLMLF